MNNKSLAAVFLGVGVMVLAIGVVVYNLEDVLAEPAGSQVLPVAKAVWGFLGSKAETEWVEYARFGSWAILVVGVIWGVIGAAAVYGDKLSFPSLAGRILRFNPSALPIWVVVCIAAVAPFEGVARLVCGAFGAVRGLVTFDLKRLVRRKA